MAKANKASFETWMAAVDTAVLAKTGVSVHDLDDYAFRDAYDDGVSAVSTAARAIRAAKEG